MNHLQDFQSRVEKALYDVRIPLREVREDIDQFSTILRYRPTESEENGRDIIYVRESDVEFEYISQNDLENLGLQGTVALLKDREKFYYFEKTVYEVIQRKLENLESRELPEQKVERYERLSELEKELTKLPQQARVKTLQRCEWTQGGYEFSDEDIEFREEVYSTAGTAFPGLKGAAESIQKIRQAKWKL